MKQLWTRTAEYLLRRHRHMIWVRVVSAMACVVVFCTTYALILPAITLEKTSSATGSDAWGGSAATLSGGGRDSSATSSDGLRDPRATASWAEKATASWAEKATPSKANGRVYKFEDDSVAVEVTLLQDSEVPEDAVLSVKSIAPEEDEYALLKEQAEEAVAGKAAQIAFYDISFYTPEGTYLPVADNGVVTLRLKEAKALEAAEKLAVLHYQTDQEIPAVLEEAERKTEEDGITELMFETEGFSVFAVMAVEQQSLEELNGNSYAIVNWNGSGYGYGLTADETEVNGVSGLAYQSMVMVDSDSAYPAAGSATVWTFHLQDDGTYTISTKVAAGDETKTKYLRFCEEAYQGGNDGRGSLTLTDDENNATHVVVELTDESRVTLNAKDTSSYVNSDSYYHKFWCFNSGEGTYSQQYLCKIVQQPDYSGSWVIVNQTKSIAMQSEGLNGENSNRAGLEISRIEQGEDGIYTAYDEAASVWEFVKQEDGTYHISTTVSGEPKYLTIGTSGNAPVTLSETPQNITVATGAGDNAGKVRLTNGSGWAVNLYGSSASQGFGTYNDSGKNEWQLLCRQGAKRQYDTVKSTVNHKSSVINLFDYWITEQDAPDNIVSELEAGINEGHNLKFVHKASTTGYNTWTGNINVYKDIVKSELGEDGYPVLKDSQESLAYLFDPLHDAGGFKEIHRNVSGLLQVDSQGYYYYDSAENFAEYNSENNSFTLYDTWGVRTGGSSPNGQFFPFNSMEDVMDVESTDAMINHYLGLTLTTRFVQKYGGHTTSKRTTDTVFEFAGDDDVWIFIDDVLVADLGGIHNRATVSINFDSGDITINDKVVHTLGRVFTDAGKTDSLDDDGNTFADNTYHTLKFFYLERGNTDSNLRLHYNLTEIPQTAIYKVNQYGVSVPGAEFSVYRADENYNQLDNNDNPVYVGVTDEKGEMVFLDDDGMPYSLSELKSMFGEYFILKETKVPEDYSIVSEEIHLHIKNGLLLCENTYDSGVWAASTLQVVAPGTLKRIDGGENIEFYTVDESSSIKGTLFGVVLKYTGSGEAGLKEQKNWSPVYGSGEKGYTIVDVGDDFIGAVIDTAKKAKKYGDVCFAFSSNAVMQLVMENLPGNVTNYYYMLDKEHKGETQYTIAYYWTEGDLDQATRNNTYRIDADDTLHSFDRVFGATIEVPNLMNRLFVQKLNEDKELVNGAVFAMYQVEEVGQADEDGSKIYYKADNGTLIYLEPDGDGDNKGVAETQDDTSYTYEVNSESGIITVSADGTSYTITPKYTAETLAATNVMNPSKENGTATFSGIDNGTYYVREINVPTGYMLNSTEVMVLVAEDAVYANAGTAMDGVTVARGPGYLVKTLDKFASQGAIDNTLSWVYERMRISGDSHTFSAYQNDAWKDWEYLGGNENPETTYLEYAPDGNALFNYAVNRERYSDPDSVRRRLYTDTGWSYYELYQDYTYGRENSKGANYTKLTDENDNPKEIANLFSRSTYIQMTDKKIDGSLEISKTVINAQEGSGDKEYKFQVDLTDASGNSLAGSYPCTIYQLVTGGENGETGGESDENGGESNGETGSEAKEPVRELVKDADGNPVRYQVTSGNTITLKDGQFAVIDLIPAGMNYTVTEVGADQADYLITSVRDKGKAPVSDGMGEAHFAHTVTGRLYWAVDENKVDTVSTADYTNRYLSDLTISKVDSSGRFRLSGAGFVLYYMKEDERYYYSFGKGENDGTETEEGSGKTYWRALQDGESAETYMMTTDENGIISLNNIDDGSYLLEELVAPAGYYKLSEPIEITVEEGKISKISGVSGVSISENRLILTIPNSTSFELPHTGGHGSRAYALSGIAVLAGAAVYCISRRRREAE